jgi:hypothetical protein
MVHRTRERTPAGAAVSPEDMIRRAYRHCRPNSLMVHWLTCSSLSILSRRPGPFAIPISSPMHFRSSAVHPHHCNDMGSFPFYVLSHQLSRKTKGVNWGTCRPESVHPETKDVQTETKDVQTETKDVRPRQKLGIQTSITNQRRRVRSSSFNVPLHDPICVQHKGLTCSLNHKTLL